MKRLRPLLVLAVVLGLAALGWRAWGPRAEDADLLTGYVEGEPLYLSAPAAGTVAAVQVRRGDRVSPGQALFAMDAEQLGAQRARAAAAVETARAQARDVRKGQRAPELAVTQAERAALAARLREAEAEYGRVQTLARRGIFAPARLDQARAAYESARAQVAAASQRVEVGALPARADQIAAADARVVEAESALAEAEARLEDLAVRAPAEALVEDVYYQDGEWAAANQPILSLLADDRVKLRFFVPEGAVGAYRPGARVRFACDGCPAGLSARVTYVSPRPEFTPPVIYSRKSRDRLVFLVEAAPEGGGRLPPGLPVDVEPVAPPRER